MTDEIAKKGSARERVLAAAAQVADQGSGPVTLTALAAHARAGRVTVSGLREEIEQLFPGVLRSRARARVLAAAAQIAADRSGPVTVTALAAEADVDHSTVSGLRAEIEQRFPGVLRSTGRARVLAAAKTIAAKRSGPVTLTALATRARVSQSTVSRLRPQIDRRFPGVLGSPERGRVTAAAQRIFRDRSGPVTATALAAQAGVNWRTMAKLRDEIDRLFPGVLLPRGPAAGTSPAGVGSRPVGRENE
jgi:hypothetical protein